MSYRILLGDCRQTLGQLPAGSVQTCITSPPYFGLRDYGVAGQLGLEPTPQEFVAELVTLFREVRRVLADDGTVWLNLGDSYISTASYNAPRKSGHDFDNATVGRMPNCRPTVTGLAAKNLIGIPWRVALALQDDGWILRQDIIWHKPNPMPESVLDRCTKAHEYIFLLSKCPRYYYNAEAIQEAQAPSQVGRVRADVVGGTSHKQRGQHSVGHVYTGPRPRVNEDERKALRTDTENRHRTAIPGGQSLKTERPQLVRARELAAEAGLTEAHLDAIRAGGLTDTGKNKITQTGTGHNTAEVQRLAAEAKAALGGYYREFLLADTRNKRSVWTVATQPYAEAHFATFPPELIRPCVLAGSRPGDLVLDPFLGSGTTMQVALEEGREAVGCELNPEYLPLIHKRMSKVQRRLQF